ncbi:substrate-binding domain-containing protein [Arthrobacter sp. NPDC057388]|uniref:substrate-binding domain-containing protein n=1 Tax=Arthrobacter sp. NPDC057388 TaxID=3346116 RepID=UPI003632DE43
MDQLLDYLQATGHTKIAFVSDTFCTRHFVAPGTAELAKAATSKGLGFCLLGPYLPDPGSGHIAAAAALEVRATPCLVASSLVALGMVGSLRQQGISVPEDLSVIGCEDIPGSEYAFPALTTLAAAPQELGRQPRHCC